MAVNLSPVGGVAAQFFTNSGVPLTGGKLYTYAAGTTTPLATYTAASGNTAWTNPIVLDAAGRVPSGGEIWLTDGLQYKFVLKDSNDVLIATYDNITGINSNFVNYTNQQEIQTATAGQTVFTLTTMQYLPGTGSLSVFVDGVNQYGPGAQYAFLETDATTVTFVTGLHIGASVKFTTSAINAASYGNAFQISYTPPFTGSVPTNVGDKLAQTVSVMDFGAVGDGTTNDTQAVQDALDAGAGCVYLPQGTYSVAQLTVPNGINLIYGPGVLKQRATGAPVLYLSGVSNIIIDGVKILGTAGVNEPIALSANKGIYCTGGCYNVTIRNCRIEQMLYAPVWMEDTFDSRIDGCFFYENALGPRLRGCRRVIVTNNEVSNTCLTSSEFTVAIGLDSTDGHALGYCRDIVISNNHVRGFANAQGLLIHAGVRVNVIGNIIEGAAMGISANPYNATDDIAYLIIDGNNIDTYAGAWAFGGIANDSIIVQGGPGTPDPTQIVISNNLCVNGNRSSQAANEGGIRIGYVSRVSVVGNTITTPYGSGIYCTSTEDYIVISGNVITDVRANISSQENGIYVALASSINITGNFIEGANYGIDVDTTTATTLNGNQYDNCTYTVNNATGLISRQKTVSSGTTVDVGDVDFIKFDYASPATVATWTNVIPGKTYTFYFTNSNVTIDRSNSYLDGGVNLTTTQYDAVLMLGLPSNKMAQAAKLSANS